MVAGIADNLLLTTVLSARCPLFFAPAMDLDMYQHPSTQDNVKRLKEFGYQLIEPTKGELASGLHGFGRLEEPEIIFHRIVTYLNNKPLAGKKCLVTAGPTYEPIDPVRFIGNFSSGLMGIEIANSLAGLGAQVQLVLGPSSIEVSHPNIEIEKVTTSEQMLSACLKYFSSSYITVMAAAVADFKPTIVADKKIKKAVKLSTLELEPTSDILATLGKTKHDNQILIGFALETNQEVAHARKKLTAKNLDMIVLNSLNDPGAGFGYSTNKITLLKPAGEIISFPLKSKKEVAMDIVNAILSLKSQPK